jgi:hypothetical protein
MKKLLLLLVLTLSTTLASCGDDPVAVDPNAGRRATINAFYAHPDQTLPVYVKVGDSVSISALEYGQFASGLAPIGDRKVTFQGQSGTELTSTGSDVKIDTGRSAWVIYSGIGTDDEVIAVSTPLTPVTGFAGVRFINASKNAPKVKVHLDAAAGSAMTADFIEYGKSNNAFTTVNTNTTALVMVKEDGTAIYTLPLAGVAALLPGRLYTVVMYGNASGSGTNALTAAIKMEPLQ